MVPLLVAFTLSAPPPPAPTGTWVRESPGAVVSVKVTPRRATVAVLLAFPTDGDAAGHVVRFDADADLAVGPDGALFGVVTGFDVAPPKDSDRDSVSELRRTADVTGDPFVVRARADGDTLTVAEFRCGTLAGREYSSRNADAGIVLGRYRRVADGAALPVPKPAVVVKAEKELAGKPQPPLQRVGVDFGSGGMTLPSPHYLKHYPQYHQPDPPFPLQRELDAMPDPNGPVRPAAEIAPAPRRVQH